MRSRDVLKSAHRGEVPFHRLKFFVFQNAVDRPDPVWPFRMTQWCEVVEIGRVMQNER